jgi:MGT family glycosyltransferase
MTTLGRELKRRGNRVTHVSVLDGERKALAAGLDFAPYAEAEFPKGATERLTRALGELSGEDAVRLTLDYYARATMAILRDVPGTLGRIGADILITDQTYVGNTAAAAIGLPCVSVCCALALNAEADVPPYTRPWPYDPTPEGRARNLAAHTQHKQLRAPLRDLTNAFRREHGLPEISSDPLSELEGTSPLATIAQQPSFFDFPRRSLPATFHYTGPFHDSVSGDPVAFPFDRLDGRPLIYASMGTLQNLQSSIFRAIAEACDGLNAQLVISMGRAGQPVLSDLPGSPLVVDYAPQLQMLQRAAVAITHAGLNTALESLSHGVPMVAIPITNDQPGVAARIAHIGAGEVVPLSELSPQKIRTAVEQVLAEPRYRTSAQAARDAIASLDGIKRAADIVEQVIVTRQPVLRANLPGSAHEIPMAPK